MRAPRSPAAAMLRSTSRSPPSNDVGCSTCASAIFTPLHIPVSPPRIDRPRHRTHRIIRCEADIRLFHGGVKDLLLRSGHVYESVARWGEDAERQTAVTVLA